MASCKIVINDEVNCKIEGLDADVRRRLAAKFKYELPYARHMPAFKLGRWDGKMAYFQPSGSTYVNLLPDIIQWLDERNFSITLDDRRETSWNFDFQQVDELSYSKMLWPIGHVAAGQPIMLRDYQVELINNFLSNPQCLQEIATGAGKTIMTAALSQRCEAYGRTLIIVPSKSLVTQTEEDYINMGLDVGVYFGDRKDFGKTHTICTWQSLNNIIKKQSDSADAKEIAASFIENVVAVIVDEVHMAKAEVLKDLLTDYLAHVPIRWGLTGTIPKEEFAAVALKVSLGQLISKLSASELQDKGVLAQCHVNIMQTEEFSEFTDYQKELKYLTTDPARLDQLAKMISDIARTGNTLILVDRVECGRGLQARLSDLFSATADAPDVAFVSGEMKSQNRKDHYDEVADAQNKTIVATYGVAAVGINIPRIFNLVLIEPGKSFVRVIQSIGRGIRKAQDKENVQIWDITGNCKFAKRHLTKRKQFYKEASYPFTIKKINYK
jgi:superfamily II DNA or RNA helicase